MGHKGDILLESFTKVVTALQTKLKQRNKKGQVIKQYTHPFIQRRGLNNAFYRVVKWVKTQCTVQGEFCDKLAESS